MKHRHQWITSGPRLGTCAIVGCAFVRCIAIDSAGGQGTNGVAIGTPGDQCHSPQAFDDHLCGVHHYWKTKKQIAITPSKEG